MPRWLKHFYFVVLLLVFGGCAGSCSSCSGCGVTPLPGGFKRAERIENAGAVRVTKAGFDFISQNLGAIAPAVLGSGSANAGVVEFNIDPIHTTTTIIFQVNIDVCKGGPKPNANPAECIVKIDLGRANLTITTAAPHNIKITGTLALNLAKAPIDTSIGGMSATLNSGGDCSSRTDYANIPITGDISLETDKDPTHGQRQGYTKVKINTLTVDQNALESNIAFCDGFLGTLANLLKGLLADQLLAPLTDTLQSTVEDQLCTKQDPAAGVTCPSGSTPDSGGVCRYAGGECVGTALGTDGNINLSSALASISPGAKGGFNFLAALGGEGARDDNANMTWGDLNPVAQGMTIGMMGGAEPTPITTCAPIANVTRPTGIPIPDELKGNTVSGWTGAGPHVGIGLSERFMNYMLASTYNSGALCLGVGSSTLGSLLTSNTVGLLIPSVKDLGRQQQSQPLSLMLRPQEPPTLVIGNGTDLATDPLLKITLNKLGIDFYVFSSDRFIRAFTANFDLVIPVNLDVTAQGELQPVIDQIEVNNPSLSNAELLREDEQNAAMALAGIISSQIGGALGGAISPIDLSSQVASLGLSLKIPPTTMGQGSPGLRKLEKGSDRFLGIFAALGVAAAMPNLEITESNTEAKLTNKYVVAEGLVLPTITNENRPYIELSVSSPLDDGQTPVEYQYRLNRGVWHSWTNERNLRVDSPSLSLQGHHLIEVRSRVSGYPETVDRTPVELDVIIDKSLPEISLGEVKDGKLPIDVFDVVSPKEAVGVRWAFDDQAFGEWVTADTLSEIDVQGAATLRIEARDEEGNVGSTRQELIRGKEDPALAGGSCNCSLPGRGAPRGLASALLLALGLGAAFAWRRRSRKEPNPPAPLSVAPSSQRSSARRLRSVGWFALMGICASFSGCSCSDDSETSASGGAGGAAGAGGMGGTGGIIKPPGSCPEADTCEVIEPGLIGAYASAAVASDGTVWVAGYDDIGYTQSPDFGESQLLFGDLVVGKWNGTAVEWQTVDGLPEVDTTLPAGSPGGPPDPFQYDITGFRFGYTDPGDDVGLWTSIAVDAAGDLHVAYYDATNKSLKYAHRTGSSWAIHTVDHPAQSDVGRYAKLLLVADKPVIAYLSITPNGNGGAHSAVRVARAASSAPAAASDWAFEDAAADDDAPCLPALCGTGEECRVDGLCAATTTGCMPSCGSGTACIDDGGAKCIDVISKTAVSAYPEAYGLYIAMAQSPTGVGIAYYDRVHGNLYAIREEAGGWSQPLLVDGQSGGGMPSDTGDTGLGTSLFIDASDDWHISYVDGFTESLRYVKLTGGTMKTPVEVVDDASTPNGVAVVGDDSNIDVTGGTIRIAYQDATNGKLRWATGTPGAFTTQDLTVDGFAGAFSRILTVNGSTQVLTWWRKGKPRTEGDIVLVGAP